MNFHNLDITAVNQKNHKRRPNKKERHMLELDFRDTPEKLKEYLDIYEGILSEILSTIGFDENSDLSTTYLGRVYTTRSSNLKVEERFPISEQGYTVGKLRWNRMSDTTIRYRSLQIIYV